MAGRGTQASPLKLPKAPPKYDEGDQDRTRRLIELVMAQMGLSIQFLNVQPPPGDLDFIPASPIHGTVNAIGLVGGNFPLIQLLNPQNSGKLLVVYNIRAMQDSALTPANVRMRITTNPTTFGTVQLTSTLSHLDQNDTTTIVGVLKGGVGVSTTVPPFLDNQAQQATPFRNIAGYGGHYQMRDLHAYGQMPLILLPGAAIELTDPRNTSDGYIQSYMVWDEVSLSQVLGSTPAAPAFPLARSAIFGGFQTGEGVTAVSGQMMLTQLFNPGPNLLRVLAVGISANQSGPTAIRRTSEPTTLATWSQYAPAIRMDRRSTQNVTALLRFSVNGGAVLFTDHFWREEKVGSAEPAMPFTAEPVSVNSFPIIVKPGSAIEVATVATSSAQNGAPYTIIFLWDEIPVS